MDVEQTYESLNEFLIALIHTIFYTENVYPDYTFKLVRQYDVAMRQNSHAGVQEWVEHAAAVLTDAIRSTKTQNVSFVILDSEVAVSRYVLDTSRIPKVGEAVVDAARLFAEYRGCLTALLTRERQKTPKTIAIAVKMDAIDRWFAPESAFIVADAEAAAKWGDTAANITPVRFINGGTFCLNLWRQTPQG